MANVVNRVNEVVAPPEPLDPFDAPLLRRLNAQSDPSLAAAEEAAQRAGAGIVAAADLLRDSIQELDIARRYIGQYDPLGREVSIAVTHIEDAILRLRHGSPR